MIETGKAETCGCGGVLPSKAVGTAGGMAGFCPGTFQLPGHTVLVSLGSQGLLGKGYPLRRGQPPHCAS